MNIDIEKFNVFGPVISRPLCSALDLNFSRIRSSFIYSQPIVRNFIDASGGAMSFLLPDGQINRDYLIVKTDSSGNAVTITPITGQTINGAGSLALAAQYNKAMLAYCHETRTWIQL